MPFEGAADGNGRSDLQKLHYASVRPKGLTAERFGQIFGEFSAETVSALLAGFGHSAIMEFSAEYCSFGRNFTVSAII